MQRNSPDLSFQKVPLQLVVVKRGHILGLWTGQNWNVGSLCGWMDSVSSVGTLKAGQTDLKMDSSCNWVSFC